MPQNHEVHIVDPFERACQRERVGDYQTADNQCRDLLGCNTVTVTLSGWKRIGVSGAWLCTLAGVVTLSLLPETNPAVEYVPPVWADLAHIPAYALLTMLTILAIAARIRVTLGILVVVVLSVSLFGGVIELLQTQTGRSASMLDAAWNSVGAALSAWGYRAWTIRGAAVVEASVTESSPLPPPAKPTLRERGGRE